MNQSLQQEQLLKLIRDNERIIFKICYAYCSNKNDRPDLAQEIIYQLLKSAGRFTDDHKFTTWMYRIALNVAISFYRKTKTANNTITAVENYAEQAAGDDDPPDLERNIQILQQFIGRLKELDKALMLLYLEEKAYKEIGEILGITETNVATRISRIKEKLKQQFLNQKI